jgi:predicted SAM-dependent methyltransferase
MTTPKQRVGNYLVDLLGINPQVFRAVWLEIRAAWIRLRCRIDPFQVMRLRELRQRKGVLANIGCGPTGLPGWVNIDLFKGPGVVTVRFDCRRRLPLGDASCKGIHVEHYFEHIEFHFERPRFLADCLRCLEPGGTLRIIVPDGRKFCEAYVASGWEKMNVLGGGYYVPEEAYRAKIQAVNHTFLQSGEHFGGYDTDYLRILLEDAGFREIEVVGWREGRFPGGCIDVEQHRVYSLYMEARR